MSVIKIRLAPKFKLKVLKGDQLSSVVDGIFSGGFCPESRWVFPNIGVPYFNHQS